MVQYFLQRLEHAVRHKPAVREMLRSAYREVLILGLIAFVVFIFELAGSEEFDSEGSGTSQPCAFALSLRTANMKHYACFTLTAALEFEHIHILLFIVAAFYILFTAGLIMDWQYTVRTWHAWERRYASDGAHAKLRTQVAHLRYKLGLDAAGRLQMPSGGGKASTPASCCCGGGGASHTAAGTAPPTAAAAQLAPATLRSVVARGVTHDDGPGEPQEAPLAVRLCYIVSQPRTALRHARLATALKFADHRLQFLRDHAYLHLGEVRFSFAGYLNRASVHIFKDLVEIPVSFWMGAAWLLALDLYLRSVFQRYADSVDLRVVMLMLSASVALVSTAVRLKMYAVEHSISTREAVSRATRRAMHEACMEAAASSRSGTTQGDGLASGRALLAPPAAGPAAGASAAASGTQAPTAAAVQVERSQSAMAAAHSSGKPPLISRPRSAIGMGSAPHLPVGGGSGGGLATPTGRCTTTPVIALASRKSSNNHLRLDVSSQGGGLQHEQPPPGARVRTMSKHSRGTMSMHARGMSSTSLRSDSGAEELAVVSAMRSGSSTPVAGIALRRGANSASRLRFASEALVGGVPPLAPLSTGHGSTVVTRDDQWAHPAQSSTARRPSWSSSVVAVSGSAAPASVDGEGGVQGILRPPAVDHAARRRAQLALFWCGRPSYIGRALQAAVLLAALLAALAVRVFVPAAGGGEEGTLDGSASDVGLLVVVVIMLAVAVTSLLFSLQSVIPSFILSMHIGDLVDKHLVEATVLSQLREQVTRYSRVHTAGVSGPAPAHTNPPSPGSKTDPKVALRAALRGGEDGATPSVIGSTPGANSMIARQDTAGRGAQWGPAAWLSPGVSSMTDGALSSSASSVTGYSGVRGTPQGGVGTPAGGVPYAGASPSTQMALSRGAGGGFNPPSDDEDEGGSIRGVRGFSLTMTEAQEAAGAVGTGVPLSPTGQPVARPATLHLPEEEPLGAGAGAAQGRSTGLTIVAGGGGGTSPPQVPFMERRGHHLHGLLPARRRAVSLMEGPHALRSDGAISAPHALSSGQDGVWSERVPTHKRRRSNLSATILSGLGNDARHSSGGTASVAAAAALARQAAWDGMSARQMQLLEIAAAVEAEAAAADEARGDSDSSSVSSSGRSTRSQYGSDNQEDGWADEEEGGGGQGRLEGMPADTPVSRGGGVIRVSRGASAPTLRETASAGLGGRSRAASLSRGATRGGDPLGTVAEGSASGSRGATPLSDGATSPNSVRSPRGAVHRRGGSSSALWGRPGPAGYKQQHHGHHHGYHLRKVRQEVPGVPSFAQGAVHLCLEHYRHDHCAASVPLMNVLLLLQYVLVAVLTANWLRDVPEARQALFAVLLSATLLLLLEAALVLTATYTRERSHRHHSRRSWQGWADLCTITWCCRCYGVKSSRHDRCVRGQPVWATVLDVLVLLVGTLTVLVSTHFHYAASNGKDIVETPDGSIVPLTLQRASLAAAGVLVLRLPLRVLAPVCMRHHSHHGHHGHNS